MPRAFDFVRLVFLSWIALLGALASCPNARAFTHPGIPLTISDLETLKANLNVEPWKSGYEALAADYRSQLSYTMQGPFEHVGRNEWGTNPNLTQWRNDMVAVWNLSRMWYFTQNENYAIKAREILIAWATTQTSFGGMEANLDLGDYAYRFAGGADILRGTWPGWTQADTDKVKDLFGNVYWTLGGNTLGPTNKGSLSLAAAVAIAVFNDDQAKLDKVIHQLRAFGSTGFLNTLSNGEHGETGRDQGHSYNHLLATAFISEVLWKQGIDVFSERDNRLLAMGEYYARFNLAVNTPFVSMGTTDEYYHSIWDGPGFPGNSIAFNLLNGAYVLRKRLNAPYMELKRAAQPNDSDSFMFLKSADSSTATTPAPITYPATSLVTTGMTNVDINGASPAGSGTYDHGVWTVTGAGTDIWTHGSEQFHFLYKQVTGDCALIAKVNSVQNTIATAKAGVMIRSDLNATPACKAWVGLRPDSRVETYFHGWSEMYGGSNWEAQSYWLPQSAWWVKIERFGNIVTTYASPDGTSWAVQAVGRYDNLGASPYLGLCVTSMVPGTPCTATFSNVSITTGNGAAPLAAPDAPLAVHASPGDGRVPLRWTQSFGATSYTVKCATTSGGPYTTLGTIAGTSYVDTSATNDSTYYYVVSVTNSAGEGAHSPEDVVTPRASLVNIATAGTATDNISNANGTEGAAKAFDLNSGSKWLGAFAGWLRYDLGSGNGQPVTAYDIVSANDVPERDPRDWQIQGSNDGSNWTTLDTQTGQNFPHRFFPKRYRFTNTTPWRYYRLNVTANIGGSGYGTQISELALLKAAVPTPPPASPASLNATAVSEGQIDLSWTEVAGPVSYIVKRATTPGGPFTIIASELSTPSFSDTGLADHTTYHYVVSALGSGGPSGESPLASATTLLGPPQKLSATPGAQRITLSWTEVSDATGYVVKRSLTSGGPYTPLVGGITSTNHADTGLVDGNAYYYVVSSVNAGGESVNGTEVSATPGVVVNDWFTELFGSGDANDTASATFTFTPANNANGYIVSKATAGELTTDPAGGTTLSLGDDDYASVTLTDGKQASLYGTAYSTFYVGSNGFITFGGGDNAYTESASVHFSRPRVSALFDDLDPSTGGSVSWKQLSDRVAVTWQSIREYGRTTTNTFQIELFFDGRVRITLLSIAATDGLIGLSRGAGVPSGFIESDFSAYPSIPAAPGGVVATGGAGQVSLSWNAVSGAAGYRIKRSTTDGSGHALIAVTAGTNHVDTMVLDGASYYYVISALNATGEGAPSSEASATTYTIVQNWRLAHFGTTADAGNAADSADPDGDGWDNAREFTSGTDPNNRASALRIAQMQPSGGDLVVSFATVSGKTYRVERSDTLQSGSWTTVLDDIAGTGGTVQVTDSDGAARPKRFYRIAVR